MKGTAFLLLFLCGCVPTGHCRKLPLLRESFQGANWYTVTYLRPDGKTCADITRRETWNGYLVFVEHQWGEEWVNRDHGYSLKEAESVVESEYCKI